MMDAMPRPVHEMRRVATGAHIQHALLRSRLLTALMCSLIVDAIGTVVIYFAERNAPGTHIRTVGDALFWTTTQLTTISSQLPNPLTTTGRIADVILEAYAIVVIASIAGSFSAFLHHNDRMRMADSS
jgi:hypothetical protein